MDRDCAQVGADQADGFFELLGTGGEFVGASDVAAVKSFSLGDEFGFVPFRGSFLIIFICGRLGRTRVGEEDALAALLVGYVHFAIFLGKGERGAGLDEILQLLVVFKSESAGVRAAAGIGRRIARARAARATGGRSLSAGTAVGAAASAVRAAARTVTRAVRIGRIAGA